MHRLVTIRFSHYNEKARWALDRLRVPYRENGYMPFLHFAPVALATWRRADAAADAASSRFSTPVLVRDDGVRICDSSRIVRWASDQYAGPGEDLYPDPECERLERRFGERMGVDTRRLAYHWILRDDALIRELARLNVGPAQRISFSLAAPLGKRLIRRALAIDDEHAERSRQRLYEELEYANTLVRDRRYLVGDRFSAADLSLACMLAPAILVSHEEGYGAVIPPLERAHPEAAARAREIRAMPAGAHALRMFREERSPRSR